MVDFLLCFSVIKNTKTVLSTSNPPGAITAVHGIRTISMWWVVLGHTFELGATTLVGECFQMIFTFKVNIFLLHGLCCCSLLICVSYLPFIWLICCTREG